MTMMIITIIRPILESTHTFELTEHLGEEENDFLH
jgi:hypothetical protein